MSFVGLDAVTAAATDDDNNDTAASSSSHNRIIKLPNIVICQYTYRWLPNVKKTGSDSIETQLVTAIYII